MSRAYGKSRYGFSLYSASEAQTILGAGFADPDQFGMADLRARIIGTGFADPDQFGHADVRHLINATGFEDEDAFGEGALYPVTLVEGTGFEDAEEFGVAVLQPFIGGLGFEDADAFGRGEVKRKTEWTPTPSDPDLWVPVLKQVDAWQRVPPPSSDWSGGT